MFAMLMALGRKSNARTDTAAHLCERVARLVDGRPLAVGVRVGVLREGAPGLAADLGPDKVQRLLLCEDAERVSSRETAMAPTISVSAPTIVTISCSDCTPIARRMGTMGMSSPQASCS